MKKQCLSFLVILSITSSCTPSNTVVVNPSSSPTPTPTGSTINSNSSISGKVSTLTGSPNSSTKLELYKNGNLITSTDLSSDGTYNFNSVSAGSDYSIKVRSNGFKDFWFYNVSTDNGSKINLDQINLIPSDTALSNIKGSIKNYDLLNLQNTFIKAFNSSGLLLATALSDSNGSYSLSLPVGTGYYLEFLKSNYDKFTYKNIDVVSVSDLSLDNIILPNMSSTSESSVQGNIILPDVNLKFSRVPVKVYRTYNNIRYLAYTFLSDLNGEYKFSLPKGIYYSFEVSYNDRLYRSNNFLVNSGNNINTNVSFSRVQSESNSILEPYPIPSVLPTSTPIPSSSPNVISTPAPNMPYFLSPGTIIFTRNLDIHKIEQGSYDSTKISTNPNSGSIFPRISPDKSKIVFISNKDAMPNGSGVRPQLMYTMNVDGSNQKLIVEDNQWYDSPSWSPDGTKLLFSKNVDSEGVQYKGYLDHYEIFTSNIDGTNQNKITTPISRPPSTFKASVYSPSWSPDGTKIAYSSNIDGGYNIYVMNADGTNINKITTPNDTNTSFYEPRWSPDGTKIVYSKGSGDNARDIFVMNADGSNEKQLTSDRKSDNYNIGSSYPSWSPDGTKIIYMSTKEKYYGLGETASNGYQLFVMNADGTNQTRISFDSSANMYPEWIK